jgi:hypothetical protein
MLPSQFSKTYYFKLLPSTKLAKKSDVFFDDQIRKKIGGNCINFQMTNRPIGGKSPNLVALVENKSRWGPAVLLKNGFIFALTVSHCTIIVGTRLGE